MTPSTVRCVLVVLKTRYRHKELMGTQKLNTCIFIEQFELRSEVMKQKVSYSQFLHVAMVISLGWLATL